MPNPRLTPEQTKLADTILVNLRKEIEDVANGDQNFLFAMRRKIRIRLEHDERGTSMHRQKIKRLKFDSQKGLCPICNERLPEKDNILDRIEAISGYTVENTRLIHRKCDLEIQKKRKFTDN